MMQRRAMEVRNVKVEAVPGEIPGRRKCPVLLRLWERRKSTGHLRDLNAAVNTVLPLTSGNSNGVNLLSVSSGDFAVQTSYPARSTQGSGRRVRRRRDFAQCVPRNGVVPNNPCICRPLFIAAGRHRDPARPAAAQAWEDRMPVFPASPIRWSRRKQAWEALWRQAHPPG